MFAFWLAAGAILSGTLPASAAGSSAAHWSSTLTPVSSPLSATSPFPDQGTAIARIAIVLIVTDYAFSYYSGTLPGGLPSDGFCTGEGVIVSSPIPKATLTSGAPSPANALYILTDASVTGANPDCSGLPDVPKGVNRTNTFKSSTFFLNSSYSGDDKKTALSFQLTSAPTWTPVPNTTLILVPVPLTAETRSLHDYPAVTLATQTGATTQDLITLTDSTGAVLTSKALNPTTGTTRPSADQFLMPQAAAFTNTLPANTPPGAPIIDATSGALLGVAQAAGSVATATDSAINLQALIPGSEAACPANTTANCLATRWATAMAAFYRTTNHRDAQQPLQSIVADYADFGGAQPFLTAASPQPTATAPAQRSGSTGSGGLLNSLDTPLKIGLVVLVLLSVLTSGLIYGRGRTRKRVQKQALRSGGGGQPAPVPGAARETQVMAQPASPQANAPQRAAAVQQGGDAPPQATLVPSPAPVLTSPPLVVKAPVPPASAPASDAAPLAAPHASVQRVGQQPPTTPGVLVPPVMPNTPPTWNDAQTIQSLVGERPIFCPSCGLQQAGGATVCPRCRFDLREALTRFRRQDSSLQPPSLPMQMRTDGQGYPRREAERHPLRRLAPGTELQRRYRIERAVAQGGMGAVYRAVDLHFKRPCAVKELLDYFSKEEDRQQALEWFEREAHLLLDLHHPAIPKVFDYFAEGGQQYVVMEFIEGRTLAEVLAQEGQPQGLSGARVRAWAVQICNVLAYLHRQKPPVIFRDLKPSNIMVTDEEAVKLIDFGIARSFQEGGQATVIMTIGYAPPEQMEGRPQPQSDLYALGSTLHRLLTNREARDNQPTIFDFPPLRSLRPDLSPQLEAIIHQALQREQANRWSSAQEMEQALLRLP